MNGEELEFRDKRKANAALNDNIDRFTNCLGETAILPEGVCKDNKERIRKEHFLSFKSGTKSFRDHIVNAIFKLNEMSRFLPTKSGNPGELAILAQKIKYYEYTKCLEIPNNALDNINSNGLILLRDSSIGLEEMRDKSNKSSNSFAILDLGI